MGLRAVNNGVTRFTQMWVPLASRSGGRFCGSALLTCLGSACLGLSAAEGSPGGCLAQGPCKRVV